MNKIYTTAKKFLVTICLIFSSSLLNAQVLGVGDIAFTGYNATGNAPQNEAFSFVLLVNIPSGTQITFTDNGWLNTNAFRTGEQTFIWTAGSALVAGREIVISGPSDGVTIPTARVSGSNINAGTCNAPMLSLSVNGDQIFAYQGSAASPTFISGIHMNVWTTAGGDAVNTTAAAWEGNATSTNTSAKPAALTTGTNAIWIGTEATLGTERNNARYKVNPCPGPIATPAQVRAAANNQANWDAEFAATGATPTWIPPSGCAFLSSIFPSRLLNFTARNMATQVALNWQTDNEQYMLHYGVERSYDGRQFTNIKNITALGGSLSNNYVFNDADVMRSNYNTVYYRISFHDNAGEVFYSPIKTIKLNKGESFVVDNLNNPFTGLLEFNLASKNSGAVMFNLTDWNGRNIINTRRNVIMGDNHITIPGTTTLANGIYTMVITSMNNDKKVFKLVKNSN